MVMGYKLEIKRIENRMRLDKNNCVIHDEYIRTRYYQSVCWYLKYAVFYKHLFTAISIINIILPAIVTLINSFSNIDEFCKITVTVLSLITSVLGAIVSFFKAHEKWLNYRTVAEQLQGELSLLIRGYGKYSQKENERIFLERIELIMAKEHECWVGMNTDGTSHVLRASSKGSYRKSKHK